MFGSTTLDIVISLVFIYLLYSLLITIIGEMVANWLGVRARILRKAIEKMLNDGYEEEKDRRFNKLRVMLSKFFLQESADFPQTLAGRFYDQPSIKYLTRGHKKSLLSFSQTKPSYFSGKNFSDTVAQLFRNKGNGYSDMEKIRFCIKYNTLHIQQETLKQFENMLHDAGNNIEQFRVKLEEWFDETMDRASGWYKKKLQLILFWLGFIIAAMFNVDSIKIVSILSHDKDVRAQMVQLSIAAADSTSAISKAFKQSHDTAQTNRQLRETYATVDAAAKDANRLLGLGWDKVQPEKFTRWITGDPFTWYKQFNPFRKEFWGLVLTALALSLGAPFWFDLLKKLVALRSAGVKPEEKEQNKIDKPATAEQNASAVSAPVTPVLPDAEQLLYEFTDKLKKVPGVMGIGLEPLDNKLNGQLVVHVNDSSLKTVLMNIHGAQQQLANGFSLPVSYYKQQPNTTHAAEFGGEIANRTLYNGHGTLSCFLKKAGSDKTYLLSCWHVIKDNDNWDIAPVTKDIIDSSDNKIAFIEEGCLTNTMDIGIAECTNADLINNTGLQIKSQYRPVTPYDSFVKTNVSVYGKACKLKNAQIFHHQINTAIDYSDQKRMMYDLFSISIIDKAKNTFTAPTSGGDSGAIVIDSATNIPLGMIIGGNNEFSYGVKFSTVFSANSLYKNYSFKI